MKGCARRWDRLYALGAHPLVAPLAAAVVYGGWVALVQREVGGDGGNPGGGWWLPAFSHGLYAAVATLLTQRWVRWWLCRWGSRLWQRVWIALLTIALLAVLPGLIQYLVGNRAVVASILPGLTMGSLYVLLLVVGFAAEQRPDSQVFSSPIAQQTLPDNHC